MIILLYMMCADLSTVICAGGDRRILENADKELSTGIQRYFLDIFAEAVQNPGVKISGRPSVHLGDNML